MIHNLRFLSNSALIVAMVSITFAQGAGDFRSKATGTWSATSTWERLTSDALTWEAYGVGENTGTGIPNSSSNAFVLATHVITLDATGMVCNNLSISGRVDYKATTSPTSYSTTGNTNASTSITNIANMTGIQVGDNISGSGLIANTSITAVDVGNSTITISAACTTSVAGVTLTIYNNIGYDLTVNGDLTVASTCTLRVVSNTNAVASPNGGICHSLTLKGSLTNSGGLVNFRSGTSGTTLSVCRIILSGTSNTTLTVPYVSSSNGTFNYITVNKTSPGKVVLGSNVITSGGSTTGPTVCNSGINLMSGLVETGSYYLAYQGTTNAQLVGGSSASYVNGALGRGMSSSAAASKDFPVGDANGYRPVKLYSTTSGTATGHIAIVKCVSGNANTGSSALSGGIDKVSEVRYYQVKYDATLGGATSMNFNSWKVPYGSAEGVVASNTEMRVAYSVDGRTTWNGISQTVPHTSAIIDPATQITPDVVPSINITGDLTTSSTTIANVSSTTGISAGNAIIGTDIPSATTVTTTSPFVVSLAATATNTSVPLCVTPTANLTSITGDVSTGLTTISNVVMPASYNNIVGTVITGTGIAANTTITAYSAGTITLSATATGSAVGTALTITPGIFVPSGSSFYFAIARATGTTTNPLPVEMTSFTASMVNASSAILNWHTETELNNLGFEVERRAENASVWAKVGYVAGSGTSNAPKTYTFQDANLSPGVYVYRLKQIDLDGGFKYTATTQVDAGVSHGFELLSNYPNPFNPETNIRFSVPENGFATLKVFNMLGQEVATLFSGIAQAGHYIPAIFNAGKLASGVYFSRLDYNGKSLVQRMLMTK